MFCYHPELGEQKPEGQIEAHLGHYGRHYFIDTPLVLSGRGIKLLETYRPEQLTPLGQRKAGWHHYKVTEAALEKLDKQYRITCELLLD